MGRTLRPSTIHTHTPPAKDLDLPGAQAWVRGRMFLPNWRICEEGFMGNGICQRHHLLGRQLGGMGQAGVRVFAVQAPTYSKGPPSSGGGSGPCTGHSSAPASHPLPAPGGSSGQQPALNLHSTPVAPGCEADKGLLVVTWCGKEQKKKVAGEGAMRKHFSKANILVVLPGDNTVQSKGRNEAKKQLRTVRGDPNHPSLPKLSNHFQKGVKNGLCIIVNLHRK